MTTRLILIVFLLGFVPFSGNSQDKTREDFIQNFTKERFIVWPETGRGKDAFVVAIVNDTSLYNKLTPLFKKKPLFKKRKISLKSFSSFQEASQINAGLIYLNASNGISMQSAIQKVNGKTILVVGENFPFHESMINFVSINDKISFEYNKDLIEAQGLTITEELVKLSAKNEIQWNKMLAEAEEKLLQEKLALEQQAKQTAKAKQALNTAQKNLNQKENELIEKNELIDSAQSQLSLQEREIALHKKEKEMQAERISSQNKFITVMSIAIALGIIALFFIYRSYSLGRKTNTKLTELNKSLKQHKDEIFQQKTIVEEKKKEITDSIQYALRIQKSLLPALKALPAALPHSFVLFKPKDIVSGDFYWYEQLPGNKVLFTVVDCTGHGVPGALMSVIGINQLNKIVHENRISQPHLILQELDFAIRATLHHEQNEENANDGMEMAICLLEKDTQTLHFSGAFNPLWVVTQKPQNPTLQNYLGQTKPTDNTLSLVEIPADKKSIAGMYKYHHQFTLHTLKLNKGDCIYLFSDGYADQFGGRDGKKFKKQQLKESLLAIHDKSSADQQKHMDYLFEQWKGKFEQIDDVCIMGIKI